MSLWSQPSLFITEIFLQCTVNVAHEGHVEVELEVAHEHLNPADTMHGGFTATLVNITSAAAVLTSGRTSTGRSLDLSISCIGAAREGELIVADSTVQKTTRNLAFVNTTIYRKDNRAIIATGQDVRTFLVPA
ncbi:unnamed protein product [Gongylonema pulchrum]|uniref:4HBT domain-containing protein n=1 Tax=Gongylonema pulchrum TaxID=637853 RepID=A0A183DVV9_9BILA|nr:unnamed protein product [Gongylonema pulchrum]